MVLTCSATDDVMGWFYNGVVLEGATFIDNFDRIGDGGSLQALGFMFSVELISIRPQVFASTLSFSADTAMNGDSVSCRAGVQTPTQTIQVVQRGRRIKCMWWCFIHT